ncbi:hypothetical protein [Streptomyces sp. NPDC088270]|uniref:hypothetical protein n=1 Tax=unclassified Streptomyces TaxID=2593676 RepID=UPI0034134BC7
MMDTRSMRVGRLAEETEQGFVLRGLTSDDEWPVPAASARAATPREVAAALAEE